MSQDRKRWYDINMDAVRQQFDLIPTDKDKLLETMRKDVRAVTHPLLRIDALMDMLNRAKHDIPPGERPRITKRVEEFRSELGRFIAKVKSIGLDLN